jgi:predicted phage terminase large subunit-like protein
MAKRTNSDPLERLKATRERVCAQFGISLGATVKKFSPDWLEEVTPAYNWRFKHLAYICKALDDVTTGKIKRLILSVPPRHGKSELVTVRYAAWRLEKDPATRIIIGSYSQFLANKFSRKIKRIVKPRVAMNAERKAVEEWETKAEGGIRAAGVGAGVTGTGADLIIIDDPYKGRKTADSQVTRDTVGEWFNEDVYTRLEPGGAVVVIHTRWHEDDLTGRLISEMTHEDGEKWTVINLPALAEEDDPLGRRPGEALCPQRYDEKALERIKKRQGEYAFSALYQGQPVSRSGGLFQKEWFRILDPADVPANLRWVRGYDLATSTKQTADFTASAACAVGDDGTLYIRDYWRARKEWPDIEKRIRETMLLERQSLHCIEEALHGLAAVQQLLRKPELVGIGFKGVRVDKDKRSRALPWATRAESGKVAVVRNPFLDEFLSEVCAFPKAKHDDFVDAVSLAVQSLSVVWLGNVEHGEDLYSKGDGQWA